MRAFLPFFLSLVLVPATAFANWHTPWYDVAFICIWITLPVETICFWIYSTFLLRSRDTFFKILGVVLAANSSSSLLYGLHGDFHGYMKYDGAMMIAFVVPALVASIIIEWIIYLLFYAKGSIRKSDLLRIAAVGNALGYSTIALFLRAGYLM